MVFDDANSESWIPASFQLGEVGVGGSGDDELRGALSVDASASFADDGKVLRELGMAAAGENSDERNSRIEIVAAKKFFA